MRTTRLTLACRAARRTGAEAGRHDHLVCVTGLIRRERRGDVKPVVASVDRLGPAVVGGEVGDGDCECVSRLGATARHHVSYIGLPRSRSHARADAIAGVQQRDDAVRTHKTGGTGDEHLSASLDAPNRIGRSCRPRVAGTVLGYSSVYPLATGFIVDRFCCVCHRPGRVKPRRAIRPDSTRRGRPRRSGLAQQRTAGSREGSTSASATVGSRRRLSRPGRSAQRAGFATGVARLIALLHGNVPGLEGLRIQSWPRHRIQFLHTIFHGGVR